MSTPRKLITILFGLAALSACSGPAADTVVEPVAEVTTVVASLADLPQVIVAFGTIEFDPTGQRTLNSEIEARVLELNALPGDAIETGQSILRLAPSSTSRVDLIRARSDATAAQAAAARAQRLRADGLASDADVEAATSNANDLSALADSLERRAGDIRDMKSPMKGVVDALLVQPGDLVAPGAPLARLATPGSMRARIGVEIEDAADFEPGDAISLDGLDNSGNRIASELLVIDRRIDPATRMATLYASIPDGQALLPGEAVRAEITADVLTGVVAVPREAVFSDEAGSFVFRSVDGAALLTRVNVGITSGSMTQISSGVSAGDVVVVAGAAILSDGMKLKASPTGASAGQ